MGVVDRHRKKLKHRELKKPEQSGATLRLAILSALITVVVCLAPLIVYHQGTAAGKGRDSTRPGGFDLHVDIDRAAVARRVAGNCLAIRIDSHLAARSSPLSGLGNEFIRTQERTGVSAALLVGLLEAESSCGTNGSLSVSNHNGFGMKGPQPALGIPASNGYCWWPDWNSAINGAADFIVYYWGRAQTGYELRGYAASGGCGSAWLRTVEGTRTAVLGR